MRGTWIAAAALALALVAAGVGAYYFFGRSANRDLPAAGSPAYEQTTSSFYRGLAQLQVGLLDDAKREFSKAATLAPGEPAAWANLGLAHLRLGEFDAASGADREGSGAVAGVERSGAAARAPGDLTRPARAGHRPPAPRGRSRPHGLARPLRARRRNRTGGRAGSGRGGTAAVRADPAAAPGQPGSAARARPPVGQAGRRGRAARLDDAARRGVRRMARARCRNSSARSARRLTRAIPPTPRAAWRFSGTSWSAPRFSARAWRSSARPPS